MKTSHLAGAVANGVQDGQEWLTKSDRVYHALREDIMSGILRPDDRLVVSSIAQSLGVSPMPVREALNRLIQEGMVLMTPHTGARVASVDLTELCEIAAVRRELETMAARLAVPNMDEALFDRLGGVLAEMQDCLNAGQASRYEQLNRDFHREIYACCGNRFLFDLVFSLWERSSITRTSLVRFPEQNLRSYQEHKLWIEAARARDADKVAEIVYEHLRAAVETLIKALHVQHEAAKKRKEQTVA